MSDGMTEMRREQEYGESLRAYYKAIAAYLCEPAQGTDAVLRAKDEADHAASRAKCGWNRDREAVRKAVLARLEKLRAGDPPEWAGLLRDAASADADWRSLAALSPFKDKVFLLVERSRYGSPRIVGGDVEALVPPRAKACAQGKERDLVALVLDRPASGAAAVVKIKD